MKRLLASWTDPSNNVGLFVMKGAGEKAFCAGMFLRLEYSILYLVFLSTGGDVKTVWQKIHDKRELREICEFFKVEYQMNNMLAVSPVPQVD